ncbi:MAG: type II toxin-antitoxin system VapC family toxin [Deltaproteobacteria bacterium]|nr:type II toxin-antitoxin system VapC family toxin [Deltaproteobacteria bacterium]
MTDICLDASLLLALFLDERQKDRITGKMREWKETGANLVAPSFFYYEIASVIRRKVFMKERTEKWAGQSLEGAFQLKIETDGSSQMLYSAYQLAKKYRLPTIYDSCYLALAMARKAELWTLDKTFANAVSRSYSKIHQI